MAGLSPSSAQLPDSAARSRRRTRYRALAGLAGLALLVAPQATTWAAPAESTSPDSRTVAPPSLEPDSDLASLAAVEKGASLRTSYQPPGLSDRYGRAKILVSAPLSVVHKLVADYGHYRELTAGKFHASRVIGRTAQGTEVYFQIPVLGGMVVLWQVFRFQDLKPLAPGWAVVEGWYLKGNIGRGNVAWTLHAIDETHTLVTFDILVVPTMQLPQSLLDEGLRNAAGEAVEAIRAHAEADPETRAEEGSADGPAKGVDEKAEERAGRPAGETP